MIISNFTNKILFKYMFKEFQTLTQNLIFDYQPNLFGYLAPHLTIL